MSQILPMGVDDVYFLIQRLGSDCDDYQQYRELTHNAIEAILRARRDGLIGPDAGEVIWDVDWFALEQAGVYRACVADNGDGMTAGDLKRYINKLSSSGGVQSLAANYGVGAKIAGATRNPEGLVYQSWKNGKGVLAQLVMDEESRNVGFRRWEIEDGQWEDILQDIAIDSRPDPIEKHGVCVTLMGTHEYDHTFLGPKRMNTDYKSWWLFRTLNRRYFRLPVTVKVRVFQTWDPDNWPKTPDEAKEAALMRTVFGQKYYLDMYSLASGTVPLTNATAHYFIMDPHKGMDQRQFFEVAGHTAALYQDELLEMRTGNTGRKLLQNFGAVFSAKHLVIYVEPLPTLGQITTNTARTELIVDGRPLPWMEWADEFRESLPGDIKELEHEISERGRDASHADTIRERLRKIRELYKVTRYKPAVAGPIEAANDTFGNVPRRTGIRRGKATGSTSGGGGGRAGNEYLARRSDDGEPSKQVSADSPEPRTDWVSVKDGNREQGDMEDRAARYLPGEHRLLINADFRVFHDLIAHFKNSYKSIPGAERTIADAVHEWCEQQLVEAVMGVRAVEGSNLWNQAQLDMAWSEEALTAVVMPRYHTWVAVKRELGRKLVAISD